MNLLFCHLQQTDLEGESQPQGSPGSYNQATGPKRLHVSNIPFRFREADLRNLLGVSEGIILVKAGNQVAISC